ncbi:hypothetical protein TVAG_337940 [Trichomonas vaginalis G3]|uniref:Uncharacterized protein n=1 Tax=Trichomonas vaginalis (strain ATCC PRA-98 / G3) TaxID=412133 RepID=A2FFF3_TRIV3|nr:hypothetical protein TVAG_337940 [Trichomonas vaginalis G3]|eukprot:XP_001309292.1 hypothetical protein [Trichomonas vaginalis G3]
MINRLSISIVDTTEHATAEYIKEYINSNNIFGVFEYNEIEEILKISKLTTKDFITLLNQSSNTVDPIDLYKCTRNTNVSIQKFEEVISFLNSIKDFMKLGILDGVIDFIQQLQKQVSDTTEELQKLQARYRKVSPAYKVKDFFDNYVALRNHASEDKKLFSKECEEKLWEVSIDKEFLKERNIFHAACEKGELNLVKSLIEWGCDKEMESPNKRTPLIFAAQYGQLDVVKYLISIGANKEAKDNNGNTSLIIASSKGHLHVVQYLISVGADKEAKNDNEETPIIIASKRGQIEVVQSLISVGANKEAKDKYGWTPLASASATIHLETVKYLISQKADKEVSVNGGATPLIIAAQNGQLEVVKYLISKRVDKKAAKNNEYTSLILASLNGHLEVVKYFISLKANKDEISND